jgi:hypothetical protein
MVSVIAMLSACHPITFVRKKALIKNNALLTEIYRAAGSTINAVENDFRANKFVATAGSAPVFGISKLLQEEGGVVRWKNGKLQFFRNRDLFQKKSVMQIPDNANENVVSGFLERHEIPSFYSIDNEGCFIYGNRNKERSLMFVPGVNRLQLENMSRILVRKKISRVSFNEKLCAGDLIDVIGAKPLVIVTAAHVFQSNTDNQTGSNQFTKLWLSSLEG